MSSSWYCDVGRWPGFEAYPRNLSIVEIKLSSRSGSHTNATIPYSAPLLACEASRLQRAMASALRLIIRNAAGYSMYPPATRAANSPREWPRVTSTTEGVLKSKSCSRTRKIMILVAMIAGWASPVAVRTELGPSDMVLERGV